MAFVSPVLGATAYGAMAPVYGSVASVYGSVAPVYGAMAPVYGAAYATATPTVLAVAASAPAICCGYGGVCGHGALSSFNNVCAVCCRTVCVCRRRRGGRWCTVCRQAVCICALDVCGICGVYPCACDGYPRRHHHGHGRHHHGKHRRRHGRAGHWCEICRRERCICRVGGIGDPLCTACGWNPCRCVTSSAISSAACAPSSISTLSSCINTSSFDCSMPFGSSSSSTTCSSSSTPCSSSSSSFGCSSSSASSSCSSSSSETECRQVVKVSKRSRRKGHCDSSEDDTDEVVKIVRRHVAHGSRPRRRHGKKKKHHH